MAVFGTSEGNEPAGAQRQTERIHHRHHCQIALPSWEVVLAWPPQWVGAGYWGSGLEGLHPRQKIRVACHERDSDGASMTVLKGQGKAWPPREARILLLGSSNSLHPHRTQELAFFEWHRWDEQWLWNCSHPRGRYVWPKPLSKPARKPEAEQDSAAVYNPRLGNCQSCWRQGTKHICCSHNPRGECITPLRL